MKEYIAKTGGRYTYNDDLLNLQELAMSMTAIFDGCSNFIISGCTAAEGRISPGYVWIGGRVRHFEGAADVAFPYYIYEKNHYETIAYAGDVNKHGRCNYLSVGGSTVPQIADEVTGQLPGFIEVREDYAPRFIDKFIGRYALLLDTPFSKQTVKKDLVVAGRLTAEKDLESKTAVSVVNPASGYSLRGLVKEAGDASVGLYHNGLLVNEIQIGTDGSVTLYRQGVQLCRIDERGLSVENLFCGTGAFGSIRIRENGIYNFANATDSGEVAVNRIGYNAGNTKYRNFAVYDGRTANPLLLIEGKTSKATVNGAFVVNNGGSGIGIKHPAYTKAEHQLTNLLEWLDRNNERLGYAGYIDPESFDLALGNEIGNMVIASKGWVDVRGELRVGGRNLADIYVSLADSAAALSKKVDKVSGKGLSEEDFTSEYRAKLDSILKGSISSEGDGLVSAADVAAALRQKLNVSANLSDVADIAAARTNLGVYAKGEGDGRYLRITNYLDEITTLSALEIEDKTPEQIIALKQQRQSAARESIDAERKGTGELKLAKASNLSDVADRAKARQNLDVYSITQIDEMLAGKLGSDQGYTGVLFTSELKAKLDGIKTGVFAGEEKDGVAQSQVEGYVTTSSVAGQLRKYAPRLMDGYTGNDKTTVAANLGIYTKADADGRFGALSQSFQDFINYLVRQGSSSTEAQQTLRDKLAAAAKSDLDSYLRKDRKLSDLTLGTENDRRQVCATLGAAFASDYQTKLEDTGWISCGGQNAGTLWARQIGNVVCVQGTINTARRDSNTWGTIATIPNAISPPRFGCRQTMADFNDDHKYNRGVSYIIKAGSRNILMHERGAYNVTTELSFSYMT